MDQNKMREAHMRQKAMVLAVVAFFVAIVAGAFLYSKSQTVMAGMNDRLETELTKALGSAVSVRSMEIASLNKVTLSDVVISDSRGGLIAAAPKVTVAYSPLALLRGQAAVDAVRELSLDSPRVNLVRQADGKWNIDDLLAKTRSSESQFGGMISINKGSVAVSAPQGKWQLADIDAGFDFADKPDIAFKFSATYKGAPLEATGRMNKEGEGMVAAGASNLDLDGLAELLPPDMAVKLTGGRLAQGQIILRRDKSRLVYAGEAKFADVAADAAGVAVREIRGSVAFSDKQILLFPITAKVYGQDVELRGKIALGDAEPVLGLTVSAAKFDPAALGEDIPVRGPLAFTATVGGTPTQPVVSLKADVFGGQIKGTGTFLPANKTFNFALNGRNLDLAALPYLGVSLGGRADVDLRAEGTGDLAAAKIAGTLQASDGQVDGVPFASMSAGFFKTGGHLTVDYITVGFPGGGTLSARGTADNGQLALNFFGQGIPLASLAGLAGSIDLAGTADAEGTVDGSTDAPRMTARFTAYNGRVLKQPFAIAKGNLALTRDTLTLTGVEAMDGAARHTVNGTIGLTGAKELSLTVATRQARAENIVKLIMPGERLTGNIDNDVTISGPLAAFAAEGHIRLSEGSFRDQLIARAEGYYRRQGGVIELRDFVVSSLNAEVRLGGTISATNQLDLKVSAKDIDLAAVQVKFPYPVAGKTDFTGRLTGTPEAPVFDGEIAAAGLRLNGQEITNVEGQVNLDARQLSVPHFGFSQGEGRFTFAGGIGFADGTIYGDLDAKNGDVAGLLAILGIPAKDIDGRLDGHISLGGTVANPDILLTGTLTKGKIKNYPLDNIEADIALNGKKVTINRFFAKQGDGVLAARGTATIGGPLDVEISGRGLDAGLLTAWTDATVDTRGKITFTAQISGTSYSPYAAVSLEINGGGVANATFDSLYGLFVLDKGSINVNQLLVNKGPYRASAYGTVPLAALNREGRERGTIADQMDLKVRLEQADLSILPLLTKEVAWAAGPTNGELTVGGTLAQPLLYGSIVIKDGTVKLKQLADPVQKVGVDIQFEGDKINIKTFDGSMGGGSYRLTGTAALKGLALADYRLLLVLDKLGVNHKYFKGPLDGTLTLDASGGKPVLAGRMIFDNTTLNVPLVPEFASSGLNIGLDLEIVAAKRVRLFNPYFYDLLVEGKARFTGSTLSPQASGHFSVVRGSVNYLRTKFKVDSGSADFTQFASLMPVIRMTADTKLEYTTVKLAVSGPLNAMDFRLSSEPAMSQQQILSLLTLRSRYYDKQGAGGGGTDTGLGRDELLSLLDAGLQIAFVAEAESAFRNTFGLDEFRLVRTTLAADGTSRNDKGVTSGSKSTASTLDREVYNIEIGKYVSDRLFISYTMGLDHKETSAYIRYDFTRRFSVTGAIDEFNRKRVGVEARFTF
jgi:translocation and assembly module TamB